MLSFKKISPGQYELVDEDTYINVDDVSTVISQDESKKISLYYDLHLDDIEEDNIATEGDLILSNIRCEELYLHLYQFARIILINVHVNTLISEYNNMLVCRDFSCNSLDVEHHTLLESASLVSSTKGITSLTVYNILPGTPMDINLYHDKLQHLSIKDSPYNSYEEIPEVTIRGCHKLKTVDVPKLRHDSNACFPNVTELCTRLSYEDVLDMSSFPNLKTLKLFIYSDEWTGQVINAPPSLEQLTSNIDLYLREDLQCKIMEDFYDY